MKRRRVPYLIAEAGVNHNGSLAMACDLVRAAKDSGADAIKFQTFKAERVARSDAPKAAYQLRNTDRGESQIEMLRGLELSRSAHGKLRDLCGRVGLDFLSTPYNREDVRFLRKLGVSALKLASIHLFEPDFLEETAAEGLPLFLSTGMGYLSEVDVAVRAVRRGGVEDLTLLHCTTNYPSAEADANLLVIPAMREAFKVAVGYSDHTQDLVCALGAVALGAEVIEKHFTLDRSLPGPDQSSAADPEQFSALAAALRTMKAALGDGLKRPVEAELQNRPNMCRSLVAARDIPAGSRVRREQVICQRPADGLAPGLLGEIKQRKTRRKIARGEVLQWGMFE